jgi:hypothetical protein
MLDAGWTRAQALAWQVMRRGDDVFVGHSGGTFGYSSSLLLEPREGVGAIVLSNGTGSAPALALELLAIGLAAIRDARPLDAQLPTRVPERFGELLGLYAWEDLGAHARIEWRAGVLALVWPVDAGEEPQVLEPTDDPLRFVVRGGRETGEACVFRRGADGAISGLTLRGWPLARLLAARE